MTNHSKAAIACDVGHPYHRAVKRDTRLTTPEHDDPTNYTSRNDWQKALWKSKIDQDAKRYIKSLENLTTENWGKAFESLWGTVEEFLDRGLPLTDDVLITYITDSSRKQLRSLDREAWDSAFNGLYTSAREQSYRLTGYGGEKRRVGQVVDTLEEQAVLARLRQTALEKVRSITDEDLKAAILEALSKPGAYAENPVAIANRIISEERRRLKRSVEDRSQLKEMVRDLYENQAWKVERITRTEAANAYWLSVLTGYREQGIEKFTFHSHSAEQRTCPICLALDGTEHNVLDWLSSGRYPLSTHTHPQCRCWPTPVISHVTLQSMESLYEDRPDLFAPGETVFDKYQMEIEDVVREYQTIYGTQVQNLPVEREGEVREALDVIRETPYQEFQPTQLRFVRDVGAEPAFKEQVPEPVLGQVTAWTTPDNELLLSQFVTDTGNTVTAAVIREWAGKVYDSDDMLQVTTKYLYDRDEVHPADIRPSTIEKLLKTFEPHTMMRTQLIDGEVTVALEKRLRDAPEKDLQKTLDLLGIPRADVDTLVSWRDQRPVWTEDGKYVESVTGSSKHNRFINRMAETGPREMFVESATAYVDDPWTLHQRDPDLYALLRNDVFGGREFRRS